MTEARPMAARPTARGWGILAAAGAQERRGGAWFNPWLTVGALLDVGVLAAVLTGRPGSMY
ncbi:hypothetical protein [Streptomyces sp. NPDC048002]|uniref:hypothetical protein n=1 Tax=unclassified Streptomyces TaxID=2593676 RepID=UPI0033D90B8C